MAKATLSTNYIDDILHESAGGKRKYRMNYNEDGTVSFDDVTVYEQEGSDYGAGDINRTNEAVNQSFDKNKIIRDMDAINAITQEGYAPDALALKEVNESLQADNGQGFQFAYDSASGKYGYKAEVEGADTFFPFKSDVKREYTFSRSDFGQNVSLTFTGVKPGDYLAFIFTRQVYGNLLVSGFNVKYTLFSHYAESNIALGQQERGTDAYLYKITVPESGSFTVNTTTSSNRSQNFYIDLFSL